MDADDLPERPLDRREPAAREPERAAEIPEIVVVPLRRDGIEQRTDRIGKVLVDVGVRPQRRGAIRLRAGARNRRGDRARLHDPDAIRFVDRPLDVLRSAERRFDPEAEAGEIAEARIRQAAAVLGFGRVTDRSARAIERDAAGVHAAGHQRLAGARAVLDDHRRVVSG